MKEIDVKNWERDKSYNWFKSFSNSTYSCNVVMDVTKLVNHVKKNNQSFFIDMLFIVLKGLNSIDEMRMRLVDVKPVIYDDINPAFTVMTRAGTFENVRFKNIHNFKEFYKLSQMHIENAKTHSTIKKEDYNPKNCYNEYYITCLPWVDFVQMTHPIPDDKHSQCIPRICWGKYTQKENKFQLTLNITVSHILVDGYPLSKAFNTIQDMLNNVENILK